MGIWFRVIYFRKKKKKRKKKWQSCQSKTKEKKLVTFSLEYALSLCTIKTAEVIGEVSRCCIVYVQLPIYIPTNFHVLVISLLSVVPIHYMSHSWLWAGSERGNGEAPKRSGAEERSSSPRAPSTCNVRPIVCAVSAVLLPKCYALNAWAPPNSYGEVLITPAVLVSGTRDFGR